MIKVNVAELKANLSAYLEKVEAGEVIVICRRNEPIGEIHPLRSKKEPRPFGLSKGEIEILPSFFDPLPDDLLDLYEGKGHPDDPLGGGSP